MPPNDPQAPFSPTRWSLVIRAQGESPDAKKALRELCEAYYEPVFRFLRREGRDEASALELTQAFFESVLQSGDIRADKTRGRFRSYLLGAVKHFLADQRKLKLREKRGKGVTPLSLDAESDQDALSSSPSTSEAPDAWFDRQWALNVMERGLSIVATEWRDKGKSEPFEALKHTLSGNGQFRSQAEISDQLGWTETATKVAIHRLRKRFREVVRSEIADTLPDFADVDAERRYLIEALRQ